MISEPWQLVVWAAALGISLLLVLTPLMLLASALHAAVTRHRVEAAKELGLSESADPPTP